MNIQDVLKLADRLVFNHTGKHLDDLQKTIIEGVWHGKKYADIAEKIPCSEGYIRDTASDLWKILSSLSGENINKSNFCSALERLQFSVYSKIGDYARVGINRIDNKLNLCSDRLTSSENQTNGKKRNRSANKKSEDRVTTLPNKNIREAPELGKMYGRVKEISTLENWILQENSRLIGILGISGIGKTTLSRNLLEKIQDNFDYIIWKNLDHAPTLSTLVAQLVLSLSNQIYIDFSLSETTEKNLLLNLDLETLLSIFYEYLRNYRCLIILDNLQTILAENKFSGNYQNQFQNYSEFFKNIGELPHQSCLIFNSWESPLEIINLTDLKTPVRIMSLNGIGETAREIFQAQNLSDEESWQKLIDTYRGNPYHLKIVCRMIQEIFNGKLRDYLAYNSLFLGDEIITKLDKHFQRLSILEKQVISQLSQIDKPVTVTEILEKSPLSPPDLFQTIQSLGRRSLIEKITQEELTLFTVSPVIREYFNN